MQHYKTTTQYQRELYKKQQLQYNYIHVVLFTWFTASAEENSIATNTAWELEDCNIKWRCEWHCGGRDGRGGSVEGVKRAEGGEGFEDLMVGF